MHAVKKNKKKRADNEHQSMEAPVKIFHDQVSD